MWNVDNKLVVSQGSVWPMDAYCCLTLFPDLYRKQWTDLLVCATCSLPESILTLHICFTVSAWAFKYFESLILKLEVMNGFHLVPRLLAQCKHKHGRGRCDLIWRNVILYAHLRRSQNLITLQYSKAELTEYHTGKSNFTLTKNLISPKGDGKHTQEKYIIG